MSEKAISDLVQLAIKGDYQIPEFQREFIWRPAQVAAFADSLSSGFPVGCIVVWPQAAKKGKAPHYIIDGQQRVTALCVMFGKRPDWQDEKDWNGVSDLYSQYLNVSPKGDFSFGRKKGGWISLALSEILAKTSEEEVTTLVSETLDNIPTMTAEARNTLYEKTKQIWNIQRSLIPVVEVTSQEPMDVVEMYKRLNLEGSKIRETDTQLAFIAVMNPGWVKDVFRGFINHLDSSTDGRWSLPPGDLLRCMTILDSETPRVSNLKNQEEFWESGCIVSFDRVKKAINDVIQRLHRYGINSRYEVPSNYSLIALFTFHAHFSKAKNFDFGEVFRWFLTTNVYGRYGHAPLEYLTKDVQSFMRSNNPSEALAALFSEMPEDEITRALEEELSNPFKRNSPVALLLKVLLWDTAIDWRKGGKLSNYPPLEWHHIFPLKFVKSMVSDEKIVNNISNMTPLSTDANKEFKDKPPWVYAPNFIQDPKRLESHFIPKSYAKSFTAGKEIVNTGELSKFLSERLKLIQSNSKQLLGL